MAVRQPHRLMVHDFSEHEIGVFLHLIHARYGYDFSEYAKASMQRRISRFMIQKNLGTLVELTNKIEADPAYFQQFLLQVTVNVTEMFRDPEFYKSLRTNVLPQLKTYPFARIWDAGCSTGEETYSLSVLFEEEHMGKKVKIYATDINQKVLAQAKEGSYPLQYMKDYSKNYLNAGGKTSLSDFYEVQHQSVVMHRELSEHVIFSTHNLVSDGPFNEFNLIVCRNVLIYFQKELQERVIDLFRQSLPIFGYLALGNKESLTISKFRKHFEIVDSKEKIYRRIS